VDRAIAVDSRNEKLHMQTIAIVGLGLIGGSLGLDFVAQGYDVIGIARRRETCEQALSRGAVNQAGTDLSLVKAADIVMVCTPMGMVTDTVAALVPYLRLTTVVTDVASVKGSIVPQATALWPNFVGGHPMAGKAQAGIGAAELGLFKQCPYVLTPIEATNPAALAQVKQLVGQLRGCLYECLPHEHDQAVAWISHLPVMISSCLIQSCQEEASMVIADLAKKLASSGFRDTSRVGGGDPQLGVMMAQHNRVFLLRSLEIYQDNLQALIAMIRQEDWQNLTAILLSTQAERRDFFPDA
jgi:arogenate dehydrogenase (NADP+)